mmetsp:Transcript_1798/g.4679  ORF Transcript_1798/g.4679 Transcript_1798/m.4679 type:complete len:507 (-) Transcript_1798:533-2053(-)
MKSLAPAEVSLLLHGRIHGVNLLLVVLLQLRALHLERGGQQALLDVKGRGLHEEVLHHLEALELGLLPGGGQALQQHLLCLRGGAHFLEVALDVMGLCPRHHLCLHRDHHGHQAVLKAVAIHPQLLQHLKLLELALHLLHSDVLALRQLEDVLDAVDDPQIPVLANLTDVASVEPAITLKYLLGDVLPLEVAREHGVAADQDLAARGVSQRVVVHVRHRLQPDLHARERGPDVGALAAGDRDGGACHRFGEAVSLRDSAHHANLEELHDVRAKRGGTRDDELHAAAQRLLELGKDELVEEGGSLILLQALSHERLLARKRKVEQAVLDKSGRLHLGHHAGIDAIKHARHTSKEGGPQLGNVLEKVLDVAPPVANTTAHRKEVLLHRPVKDVGQRQVGQEHVVGADALAEGVGGECRRGLDLSQHVAVLDHDALGVASGARGIHDGAQVLGVTLHVRHGVVGAGLQELIKGGQINAQRFDSLLRLTSCLAPIDHQLELVLDGRQGRR